MSTATPKLRMHSVPGHILAGLLRGALAEAENPDEQRASHRMASHHECAAIFSYELGAPLSEVWGYARQALAAYLKVLQARPSLERLTEPQRHGGRLDYSIGASDRSLHYLYWALLLADFEASQALARGIWEPQPDGRKPVLPTYRLAFALRDIVLGREADALSELEHVGASAKRYEQLLADAMRAIARGEAAPSVAALRAVAEAHKQAMRTEVLEEIKTFCLPGAGLAALALDRGLANPAELPSDVDSFPSELLLDRPPRAR